MLTSFTTGLGIGVTVAVLLGLVLLVYAFFRSLTVLGWGLIAVLIVWLLTLL